jgi:hypothetical protein
VSIAAVAFVPCAPLLIPAVAGGSADCDDDLRAASLNAVTRVTQADPHAVPIVVAATAAAAEYDAAAPWSVAGFGVGRAPAGRSLPWPLGIGAWLLDETGWSGERRYLGVTDEAPAAAVAEPSVVIAVGDGSGCRTERAPGHLDPRADGFDARIADCLSRGDIEGLAATDGQLAAELLCAGLPVWRWLADALGDGPAIDAELVIHVAPYGVGYFVASWSVA